MQLFLKNRTEKLILQSRAVNYSFATRYGYEVVLSIHITWTNSHTFRVHRKYISKEILISYYVPLR